MGRLDLLLPVGSAVEERWLTDDHSELVKGDRGDPLDVAPALELHTEAGNTSLHNTGPDKLTVSFPLLLYKVFQV